MKGKGKPEQKNKKPFGPGSSSQSSLSSSPSSSSATSGVISDPRFAHVHEDPRFSRYRPKRSDRGEGGDDAASAVVDERFSAAQDDERFHGYEKSRVDEYGRRKVPQQQRGASAPRSVPVKKAVVPKKSTAAPKEADTEDSDSESKSESALSESGSGSDPDTDDLSDSDTDAGSDSDDAAEDDSAMEGGIDWTAAGGAIVGDGDQVPLGSATREVAVLNLDWDHVRAVDLYVLFQSFCSAGGGSLVRVSVYPSEYGARQMEYERQHGPNLAAFMTKKNGKKNKDSDSEGDSDSEADSDDRGEATTKVHQEEEEEEENEEEDEENKVGDGTNEAQRHDTDKENTMAGSDPSLSGPTYIPSERLAGPTAEHYETEVIRAYELQKLRYYYAIAEFDSVATAAYVYDQCDGLEFERTGNVIDLRFVPAGTPSPAHPARDSCTDPPTHYDPVDYHYRPLQQSTVQLTWDEDDAVRKARFNHVADTLFAPRATTGGGGAGSSSLSKLAKAVSRGGDSGTGGKLTETEDMLREYLAQSEDEDEDEDDEDEDEEDDEDDRDDEVDGGSSSGSKTRRAPSSESSKVSVGKSSSMNRTLGGKKLSLVDRQKASYGYGVDESLEQVIREWEQTGAGKGSSGKSGKAEKSDPVEGDSEGDSDGAGVEEPSTKSSIARSKKISSSPKSDKGGKESAAERYRRLLLGDAADEVDDADDKDAEIGDDKFFVVNSSDESSDDGGEEDAESNADDESDGGDDGSDSGPTGDEDDDGPSDEGSDDDDDDDDDDDGDDDDSHASDEEEDDMDSDDEANRIAEMERDFAASEKRKSGNENEYENEEDGDMEMTFDNRLSGVASKIAERERMKKVGDKKGKGSTTETVWERHLREKAEKRKAAKLLEKEKQNADSDSDGHSDGEEGNRKTKKSAVNPNSKSKSASSGSRKSAAEAEADRRQKAELELLMLEELPAQDLALSSRVKSSQSSSTKSGSTDSAAAAASVQKKQKRHRKLSKSARRREEMEAEEKADLEAVAERRKRQKRSAGGPGADDVDGGEDANFNVNVRDDRFEQLFSSHHFAIDPTNPHFKKSDGMKKILDERVRRRTQRVDQPPAEDLASRRPAQSGQPSQTGESRDSEISALVKSLKRKNQGRL